MKKFYLLVVAVIMSSCSMDDDLKEYEQLYPVLEVSGSTTDSACEDLTAGPDNSRTITLAEAQVIESWDEVRKLFLSLLAEGVSRDGEFDPEIWDLIERFNKEPLGEFTTVYTVTDGTCSDSVKLTITVVEKLSDPTCSISAGGDNTMTITRAEADAIPSWDEVRKLYLSLLDPGVPRNGKFDPSIWDLINAYGENQIGNFTTTYTVEDGECSDSVQLTITVVEGPDSDPTCIISAGKDNSTTITISQAEAIPSWDEVRKLYLSLLDQGVPRNGSFDPSIWDLINAYGQSKIGSFTTTYTVTEGDCSDSTQLTISVVPDSPSDPTCNLTAGSDNSKTITYSEAAGIPSWDEARKLFLSLLEPGVSRNGSFDPSIWDLINDFNQRGVGSYSTTYTVTDGSCTDSVILTINVVAD